MHTHTHTDDIGAAPGLLMDYGLIAEDGHVLPGWHD